MTACMTAVTAYLVVGDEVGGDQAPAPLLVDIETEISDNSS